MPSADLLAVTRRRRGASALAGLALVAAALAAGATAYLGRQRGLPVPVARQPAREPAEPATAGLRVRPLSEWLAEAAAEAGLGLVLAPEIEGEVAADFPTRSGWRERIAVLARVHGFAFEVGETLIEVAALPSPRSGDQRLGGLGATTLAGASSESAEDAMVSASRHLGVDSEIDATAEGSVGEAHAEKPARLDGGDAPVARSAAALREPERRPEPPSFAVLRLTNARAVDLERVLAPSVRAAAGSLSADPASNALVVTGAVEAVGAARRLARELDVPRRRFLLEAQIVELSRSARLELGVQWSVDGDVAGLVDFPAADTPGEQAGVVVATDGAHTLRARLGALEAAGRVRVISRPRVVTVEGRPASIESVRILRVRFPESTSVVADGEDVSVGGSSRAVEEIPVGVSLIVEPALQGQGDVVLRIKAKSSTLGNPQPPDDIPEELSRMVDAEVVVGDGETAVLGGLRREGRSRSGAGVPVLRSVPWLGRLFGRRLDEREGEELIVLVTPHLLH